MAEVPFNITGDNSNFESSLNNSARIVKEMVQDFQTLNDAMDSTVTRASKIKTFFEDNVELVGDMKKMLELIASINESNQAALTNNLQAIREMLTSVSRMGGNIQDAARLINTASIAGGGGFGGGGGNAADQIQQYQQQLAANQPKQSAQQEEKDFIIGATDRIAAKAVAEGETANRFKSIFGGKKEIEDKEEKEKSKLEKLAQEVTENNIRAFGGAPGAPGGRRRTSDEDDEEPSLPPVIRASKPPEKTEEKAKPAPVDAYYEAIIKKFPNLDGKLERETPTENPRIAANFAKDSISRWGNATLLKPFASFLNRKIPRLSSVATAIDTMKAKVAENEYMADMGEGAPIATEEIWKKHLEDPNNDLTKAYSAMNRTLSKPFQRLANFRNTPAAQAFAGYQGATQLAALARQYTGIGQQYGGAMGTVDYGQSAGLALQANTKSLFGLNPFYSTQNAMQAQMQGIGIGYRGAGLNQYQSIAQNMQTTLGLSQGQIGSIIGATTGAGVSQQAAANTISAVRQAGNGSSFYNASYATQVATSNMVTGGSIGLSSSAAAYLGTTASGLAKDAIAGREQFTGIEAMNSPFGLSIVATALGVQMTDLYSITGKMGGKQYLNLYTGLLLDRISQTVGIDFRTIKSIDQLKQKAYILMQVLPGFGITQVTDQQGAVDYVWLLIQQYKNSGGDSKRADTIRIFHAGGPQHNPTHSGSGGHSSGGLVPTGRAAVMNNFSESGSGGSGSGGHSSGGHNGGSGSPVSAGATGRAAVMNNFSESGSGGSGSTVSAAIQNLNSRIYNGTGHTGSGGSSNSGGGGNNSTTTTISFANVNSHRLAQLVGLALTTNTNGQTPVTHNIPRGVTP